jgi:MFS family permease
MMTGMLLAVILYIPIYKQMHAVADVKESVAVGQPNITNERTTNDDGQTVLITKTETTFADGNSRVEIVSSTDGGMVTTRNEISLSNQNFWIMIVLVFVQVIFVAMVYGPIAAFLVELFPTRIRYTSMSLPYHIGNGIFGGLTPLIATSLYVASQTEANPEGDPYAGLYYPIIVAAISFLIGMIFLSNRRKADVMH